MSLAKNPIYFEGHTYAVLVGGVVIKKENKYLLVQEKQKIAYGLWNLPAGKVEKGFTIKKTAVKEAKEETGFDVKLVRKIGIYQEKAENAVKHVFEAKIIGGKLNFPEDEILDAQWFNYKEIIEMKDKLRNPEYIIPAIEEMERKNGINL